ncbi:MAG: hypothetical protein ACEY3M_06550 [Wolbachia sp.]
MFTGTVDKVPFYIREVTRKALLTFGASKLELPPFSGLTAL